MSIPDMYISHNKFTSAMDFCFFCLLVPDSAGTQISYSVQVQLIIYLCCTNFLAIRTTGAYVQSLWLIFKHDVIPFVVIFMPTLFAFAGAFYLALHGEYEVTTPTTSNTTSNCTSEADNKNCFQNNTTTESSSSNTYPSKTM